MKRAVAIAFIGACVGCSSLAPAPPEFECVGNDDNNDCAEGFVCELGLCRDASDFPPLAYIGVDVQEVAGGQAQFRVELAGCDEEILSTGSAVQVLSLPRAELARTLSLGVFNELIDADGNQRPIDATFTVTQPSRFNRDTVRRQVTYAIPEDSDDTEIAIPWPRYFVDNALPDFLSADGYIQWQIQPLPVEDTPARAARYHMLAPPITDKERPCAIDLDCCPAGETCDAEDVRNACVPSEGACRVAFDDSVTYRYPYPDACDRQIRGRVIVVDESLQELERLPGASVTLRHVDAPRERLGVPQLDSLPIEERPSQCTRDNQCAAGLICNEQTEQCELPLDGLTAWSGSVPLEADPGTEGSFSARTFTYCEGLPTNAPLTRPFEVTVTPPQEGLPSVVLHAEVAFDPIQGGQKPSADFARDLCVPQWGTAQTVTLALDGNARDLLEGYTCCDVDCLPRTEAEAQAEAPPEPRAACSGASSGAAPTYRIEAPLTLPAQTSLAWNDETSPCLPLVFGSLRRTGACETVDQTGAVAPSCDVLLPEPDDEGSRVFSVRLETPTGSVLGSVDTTLSLVSEGGTREVNVELPPRSLLRGHVRLPESLCDPEVDGRDCGSPGAQVLAERLRMSGETVDNTPGPYFHQVSTFYDPTADPDARAGAYVLPLDPGVWVVTALPNSTSPGGPAKLLLVDLRNAPTEAEQDLVLDEGILVTLDVGTFDRRSQVIPLDTGSWLLDTEEPLRHPDRLDRVSPLDLVDLGSADECLVRPDATTTPGCRIRRLIGGSPLPPTQLGQVRFTARDLDSGAAVVCSQSAP